MDVDANTQCLRANFILNWMCNSVYTGITKELKCNSEMDIAPLEEPSMENVK